MHTQFRLPCRCQVMEVVVDGSAAAFPSEFHVHMLPRAGVAATLTRARDVLRRANAVRADAVLKACVLARNGAINETHPSHAVLADLVASTASGTGPQDMHAALQVQLTEQFNLQNPERPVEVTPKGLGRAGVAADRVSQKRTFTAAERPLLGLLFLVAPQVAEVMALARLKTPLGRGWVGSWAGGGVTITHAGTRVQFDNPVPVVGLETDRGVVDAAVQVVFRVSALVLQAREDPSDAHYHDKGKECWTLFQRTYPGLQVWPRTSEFELGVELEGDPVETAFVGVYASRVLNRTVEPHAAPLSPAWVLSV